MNAKSLICVIAITGGSISWADLYQWTDKNGIQHFSDAAPQEKNPQNYKAYIGPNPTYTPGTPTVGNSPQPNKPSNENYARKVDNPSTDAAWSQCSNTKRQAVIAEKNRARTAEQLNEWLWQNCRGYSNELRTIEQQMM